MKSQQNNCINNEIVTEKKQKFINDPSSNGHGDPQILIDFQKPFLSLFPWDKFLLLPIDRSSPDSLKHGRTTHSKIMRSYILPRNAAELL
jgi:hypothetical protein